METNFKCEIKDFNLMWKIQEKILIADQKKILGKTFTEIADILDINQIDMFKYTEFLKIGKFVRNVIDEMSYSNLSEQKKEIYNEYFLSNQIFKNLNKKFTLKTLNELISMYNFNFNYLEVK